VTTKLIPFGGIQRGAVLLLLSIFLSMAGAVVFISLVNNNLVEQRSSIDTGGELSNAKDILISYAVLQSDYYGAAGAGPGHLPCPDTSGDGLENTPCTFYIQAKHRCVMLFEVAKETRILGIHIRIFGLCGCNFP